MQKFYNRWFVYQICSSSAIGFYKPLIIKAENGQPRNNRNKRKKAKAEIGKAEKIKKFTPAAWAKAANEEAVALAG